MKRTLSRTFLASLLAFGVASAPAAAELKPEQRALFDIYKELVEINTTDSVGDNTQAAHAMAARLVAAGFAQEDVRVLVPPGNAKKGNLVARLRGDGSQKPLLLLAHLDVVEANKEDWSADLHPFKLIERDGYYYGRGTADDKAMAAIFLANLIRYRQEGLKPKRDIVLALTADEEGGDYNGVSWLLDEHRALIEAEFGLNEGGGGRERDGKKLFNAVQATEKLYRDFDLEITNKGGHSSVPTPDNAIYRLSAALDRLAQVQLSGQPQRSHARVLRAYCRAGGRRGRCRDESRRAVERRRHQRGRQARRRRLRTTRCCARLAWLRCCRQAMRATLCRRRQRRT